MSSPSPGNGGLEAYIIKFVVVNDSMKNDIYPVQGLVSVMCHLKGYVALCKTRCAAASFFVDCMKKPYASATMRKGCVRF